MFLLYVLAVLDFLTAIVLVLTPTSSVPFRLALGAAMYLILKGILFKGDLLSFVDMIIGVYIFIAFFFPLTFLSYLLGGYLFLKAFFSMVL